MPILVCPNDSGAMQEINRNGVLIDVCTTCRGVWLDRGELEKLLSMRPADDGGEQGNEEYEDRSGKRRKRREWFDFFDFG